MNTTYKVYDKIRALAGDWEMYRNGIKWNTVFYMGDIIRGRIDKTNYESYYFTIESLENNNTITFTKGSSSAPANTFYYSLDDGATWTSSNATTSWTLQSGERVKLKATANAWSASNAIANCWNFSSSNKLNIYGNIMSLLYGDNFIGQTTLNARAFMHLFYQLNKLINASNLILPATTLAERCYSDMFYGCTSLTYLPSLPATTLAIGCYASMFSGCTSLTYSPSLNATTLVESCYDNMFYGCSLLTAAPTLNATVLAQNCYRLMFKGCTSLTTAPALPATTLATGCYRFMFQGCTSLNTAPSTLPATTLTEGCYYGMFYGCTSLTAAPELLATTLATNCCDSMFQGCTSLTTAPELLATTLVDHCYYFMFGNCTNLNYIKCLATDISANSCVTNWLAGEIPVSGTFVKAASMTSWGVGSSGIPSGWTVQNAS